MNENKAIKLAVLAGETMLASGAETSRVEDTMMRLMEKSGLTECEAFCTSTGIFASAEDEDGRPVTVIRRLQLRQSNFEKIARVNELSRRYVEGKIDMAQAFKNLEYINALRPYPFIVRLLGASVASACFAYMVGGNFYHALGAFFSAFLMQIPVKILEKYDVVIFLRNILGGAFGATFALIFVYIGLAESIEYIIIGAIMPLLPGVALTNAIRDILDGNMLAGSARIMEALLTATAIAAGVGVAMSIWMSFGGIFT